MKEKDYKDEVVSDDDIMDNNMTNEHDSQENENHENDNVSGNNESLEAKYKELNNSYLRLHAEFDNYRKRTLKEKSDLLKSAGERVIVDLLPIVDDFERAMANIKNSSDVDTVKQGTELIYNKFVDFLQKQGVKRMDVIGQPFDLEKHEAITTIPAQHEDQKDTIVDCVQSGYEMGDKVIRFPKVIVAK